MYLKRFSSLLILLIILLVINTSLQAGTSPTIVGMHEKLPGATYKFDGKAVEVIEYMSFYCHTCYDFERSIPVIKGNFPKKIKWITIPIYWGDHGSPKPGEAYLIAIDMGKGEAMKNPSLMLKWFRKKILLTSMYWKALEKKSVLAPNLAKSLDPVRK